MPRTTTPTDHQPTQRTQITLPLNLRRQIDALKKPDESLAEFIRKALRIFIAKESKDKKARIEAAKKFIGSSDPKDHPEWSTLEKVSQWQREMRKDPPRLLKLFGEDQ